MLSRFLEDKLNLVEQHFEPEHLILFGSRVYGQPAEWSDVDMILVSRRFRSIRFPERARTFVRAIRPGIGMDVLCYTPEEFEMKRREAGMVAEACERGIWIR